MIHTVRCTTPPVSLRLALPADLAAELGAAEADVSRFVDYASAQLVNALGRPLALAGYTETIVDDGAAVGPFAAGWGPAWSGGALGMDRSQILTGLCLTRTPVVEVATLTDNGMTVDPADFALDLDSGILTRFRGSWSRHVVAEYTAGYAVPGQEGANLPAEISRAILDRATAMFQGIGRDRAVRSENTIGVGSVSYANPAAGDAYPEFAGLMSYRDLAL